MTVPQWILQFSYMKWIHFIYEMGSISYMKWVPFHIWNGTYKRLFIWHLTTKLGKVCQFRWGWATVVRSSYARSALFWILGDGSSSQLHSRTPLSQARAPKLLGNWVSSRTNSIASINQLVAMDNLKCFGNMIIVQLGMINSPVGNEWFPVGNWIFLWNEHWHKGKWIIPGRKWVISLDGVAIPGAPIVL